MKTRLKLPSALLLLSTLNLQLSTCFAQGSLSPPGAPAPTMKTLDQIDAKLEKRTPISSLPVTITQPGSYYLTGSFDLGAGQDGIFVSALNVTIDLNGFTIRSFDPGNTAVGIRIDPLGGSMVNLTILNGHIVGGVLNSGGIYSGSGFGYGIYSSGTPRNVRVAGITISGCRYDGINFGSFDATAVVESCSVRTVGGAGIVASTVRSSVATDCGGYAAIVGDQVSDSRGQSNGGDGIFASSAQNCSGSSVNGIGVNAATAGNCNGSSSGGTGVDAFTAQNCSGSSGSGNGVYAYAAQNCNGSSTSGNGVSATVANNSFGSSVNGIGLQCDTSHGVAFGCFGQSSTFVGLNTYIANSCVGAAPTPISVSFKYNMP